MSFSWIHQKATRTLMSSCQRRFLVNSPALMGSQSELVRADMVFFETPGGGAVFSASSISWVGSLSHKL